MVCDRVSQGVQAEAEPGFSAAAMGLSFDGLHAHEAGSGAVCPGHGEGDDAQPVESI